MIKIVLQNSVPFLSLWRIYFRASLKVRIFLKLDAKHEIINIVQFYLILFCQVNSVTPHVLYGIIYVHEFVPMFLPLRTLQHKTSLFSVFRICKRCKGSRKYRFTVDTILFDLDMIYQFTKTSLIWILNISVANIAIKSMSYENRGIIDESKEETPSGRDMTLPQENPRDPYFWELARYRRSLVLFS